MVATGITVQMLDVLEHSAFVHAYETAEGQFAVKVDDPPAKMEEGIAVSVQVGAAIETPTVALAYGPVPPAFTPATLYLVVAAGLTVQMLDVFKQGAPAHSYDVGALVQLAVKVDDLPADMEDGLAVNVHVGEGVVTLTVA
jgi:hypothetical protein